MAVLNAELREDAVLSFIRDHPGCHIRETIRGVSHIMTSVVAARAIHRLIDDGRVHLDISVRPGGKREIYSLYVNENI